MGAKAGQRGKPDPARGARRQRFALILFGLLFVLLFVIFAAAEGIGSPSVPAGDIALIQGVPDQLSHVSEEEFEKALERQASGAKLKKTPQPGEPKYEELKEAAVKELVERVWLQGEAEERGLSVTEKEVATELKTIKEQNFPTEQAYQKFLKESNFTQHEVNEILRQQILTKKIEEAAKAEAPEPTSAEIADYYEAEKAAKFTVKASRDVRVIVNEDKSKVEAAQKELENDHSPASWKKVTQKYSPTTKTNGGLTPGVQEELLPEELKKPIFSAATGELIGPIKSEKNYLLLEVVKLHPAKTKSLKEAEAEIISALTQEKQQAVFNEFVSEYTGRWRARTHCASGFVTEQCANFKSSGHPTAPAGCFEANPKTPATECPAPVAQAKPALPGTVTVLKPKGEPLAQRPKPEASEEAGTEVPTPEGAPEATPEAEAGSEAEPSGE
ncbi:MAG: peptidyl-prolyl cis-trans isomerase [Solirubrobacterales bacterium]